MSKRYAILVAATAFAAVLGLVWAAESQQSRPGSPDVEMLRLQHKLELHKLLEEYGEHHPKVKAMKERLELLDKVLGDMPSTQVGRFALAGSPQGTVMLDTKTGESFPGSYRFNPFTGDKLVPRPVPRPVPAALTPPTPKTQ